MFYCTLYLPDSSDANAAKQNEKITPGPARFRATMPVTRYIPVPQQDPTPIRPSSGVRIDPIIKARKKAMNTTGKWAGGRRRRQEACQS